MTQPYINLVEDEADYPMDDDDTLSGYENHQPRERISSALPFSYAAQTQNGSRHTEVSKLRTPDSLFRQGPHNQYVERSSQNMDRYNSNIDRHSQNMDSYSQNGGRYSQPMDRYSPNRDRYSHNMDRMHNKGFIPDEIDYVSEVKSESYKEEESQQGRLPSGERQSYYCQDDDLANLEYLDNKILLECLRARFIKDIIYTYVGDSLVAINPCKKLSVYTREYHNQYRNLCNRSSQPPHIFWLADQTYRNLLITGEHQCVVVSGDSGAGKTESTKFVLGHLVRNSQINTSSAGQEPVIPDIVSKLEKVNPLLELFGNAATALNKNSSRFGKLVELVYTNQGKLVTARLVCFILEKFRVTSRHDREKNFHVFYSMFAGLSQEELKDLHLHVKANFYRILRPSHSSNKSSVFDSQEEFEQYAAMNREMGDMLSYLGFTTKEKTSLFKILAAVLLITNIEFKTNSSDDDRTDSSDLKNQDAEVCLEHACKVLGLENPEELRQSLLSVSLKVKDEHMKRNKGVRRAREDCDALARELYAILFYGIIDRINRNLHNRGEETISRKLPCIRLLDISGFENVSNHNGFEQFIINSTNERLHQYFLNSTFTEERIEYKNEDVALEDVTFMDNADTVDLIFEKPFGLIPNLEDVNSVNGNDELWLQRSCNDHKDQTNFDVNPQTKGQVSLPFGLTHYAGKVVYSAVGFVEKNSETIPANLHEAVMRSKNMFIQEYFSQGSESIASMHESGYASTRSHLKKTRKSVLPVSEGATKNHPDKLTGRFTSQYKKSLNGMMEKLRTATPVFVRCMKPNSELQAGVFNSHEVHEQLFSSGLLEVTKVRKCGYPVRIKFTDFVNRYKTILTDDEINEEIVGNVEICRDILETAEVKGFQLGCTKVFLKTHHRDALEIAIDRKRQERENARKERENARKERENARKEGEKMEMETSSNQESKSSQSRPGSTDSGESGFESVSIPVNTDPGDSTPKPDENTQETPTSESDDSTQKKLENVGQQPAFNIFRVTERDFENSVDFEMKIRRCVRLVMYLLLFCLILAGGIVAKIGLIWLGSSQLTDDPNALVSILNHKNADLARFRAGLHSTRLLICQFLPLLVGWLGCFIKVFFGRKDWPNFKALLVVTFLDCLGVMCRSIFIFKVLPKTDALTAIVIESAVCQVPAAFKVMSLFLQRNSSVTWGKWLELGPKERRFVRAKFFGYCALVVIALLLQMGIFPALLFGDKLLAAFGSTKKYLPLPDTWVLLVIATGVSVGWWENFAYGGNSGNKQAKELCKWRRGIGLIRHTSYVYTGPVQMIVMVVLFFTFSDVKIDVIQQLNVMFGSLVGGFKDKRMLTSHFNVYGIMYLQVISTFVCAYVSGLACRLYMQKVGFALPVVCIAPCTMCLALFCFPSELTSWISVSKMCKMPSIDANVWYILGLGFLAYISTFIVTLHIWSPEVERTAKTERLFAFPHRDPIFPDVNLACMRRQDHEENVERQGRLKKQEDKNKGGDSERPRVYICATMWHEVRREMVQLLKSLFRVDFDVYSRRKAMSKFDLKEEHSDLYDPEIHIIFDDAFATHPKTKQRIINTWVKQFIEVMPEALRSVAKCPMDLKPPTKYVTPFGGRMVWELPGGTRMQVHLKDKLKIRHRKRWSQILYLYYLLGYCLMGDYGTIQEVNDNVNKERSSRRKHNHARSYRRVRKNTSILNDLPPEIVQKADNIFLMTLDGDVDFRPEAVRLLLDRMKKNKKVAAVCGRIHPIGDGPLIWYQQFEYAVGHWLQKAAEHIFGCVLCCPGCFSLFRGSALMDDNVMRTYTTEPTEAIHYIQYEQGEDRWLCTLLLQQGYKIEYCAGADALTFAPETFNDFYVQRRRWSPSTLANIMDLIGSWRVTVKMNDNISVLFMLYQFVLMASSIVAPGTVVYMIAGSYNAVLGLGLWQSYLLSVIPVAMYMILCLKVKTSIQISVAALLSAVYAIIMLLVTVGTVINVATSSIESPDVLFLLVLAVIFVVAGFVHPNELFCLFHGILYYITVPSTFVFLTVFFLCNLHDVSWGTRATPESENPTPQTDATPAAQPAEAPKGKLYQLFQKLGLQAIIQDLKTFVQQIMGIKNEQNPEVPPPQSTSAVQAPPPEDKKSPPPKPPPKPEVKIILDDSYWTQELKIENSNVASIDQKETDFWNFMLKHYLFPNAPTQEEKEKIAGDLLSARNNVVFGYMLVNLMYTLVLLQLKLKTDLLKSTFYFAGQYEPVSTMVLGVFAMLLLTQFFGMIAHRWSTFMHLIASTKVNFFKKNDEEERARSAILETQRLTSANTHADLELDPDYGEDEVDEVATPATTLSTASLRSSNFVLSPIAEEEPDYSDSEGEEEPIAQNASQYERIFEENFRSVRKHLQNDRRRPLFARNPSIAVSQNKYVKNYHRRKSLYNSVRQDPRRTRDGNMYGNEYV